MQSLLNKEYFEDIEREIKNEHVQTNTFDNANPLETFKYSSTFNMDEFVKSPLPENNTKPNATKAKATKAKANKTNKRVTLQD